MKSFALVASCVAVLSACGGDATVPTSITVSISPTNAAVLAGHTQQFSASVGGSSILTIHWVMQEQAGGTISATGLYTAPAAAGTFHVNAISVANTTKIATATVTVTLPQIVAVTISPTTVSLRAGGTQQFSATVTGSADTAATYSIQEGASGGTISAGGFYTAPSSVGSYHVVATSAADVSKSATATVTVSAIPVVAITVSPNTASLLTGATQQFTATVTGNDNLSATWAVMEGAPGGTVDSNGLYLAPATAGTFHVIATSVADTSKTAIAAVTVTAPVIVAVSISPRTASVLVNGTQQFSASVTGPSNTAVTWSLTEGANGGAVSPAGLYTAPAIAGTYHVVATSVADTSKSSVATVSVTNAPVVVVSVSPHSKSLLTGYTQQFTATVTGTGGQPTTVTWSLTEGASAGTLSDTGLYTAPATVTSGGATYHVVATSVADSSKSDSAAVTVTAPNITVAIAPTSISLLTGATNQFTATVSGTGSGQSTLVNWSITEGTAGGSVDSNGFYTAPATVPTGGATSHLVATSVADPARSDTATIAVTAPVVTVTVSPATATLLTSGTQQFSASLTGTSNQSVTWSVMEGSGGGAIDSSGNYTAPATAALGGVTYTVVATSKADASKKGTASVTVNQVRVSVSPLAASINAGAAQQLSATVTGTNNTAVNWSLLPATGSGAVDTNGNYIAPNTGGTYQVIATSAADPTKSGPAVITVASVAVGISPMSASIDVNATQQFTPTVTGANSTTVTWTVQEPSGGSVSGGNYTAPATAGTYHVIATSDQDNTRSASATVTVTPLPVVVTINPVNPTVAPGAIQNFTATVQNNANTGVTWSVVEATGGVIDSGGHYTAPTAIGTYHVKAVSLADNTKNDTTAVIVCSSGALCTPANACHQGNVTCSASGQSCTDTTNSAPDGQSCGTGMVCNGGNCLSCAAGGACASPDPCAVGVYSCNTGSQQCVPNGPNPNVTNGSLCPGASSGTCQSGVCNCGAGSTYYQGDCTSCPAFSNTTILVNADPTKGIDNVCCGASGVHGLGGPCLTVTQALKNVPASGWSINVTPDVLGNISHQETYPLKLRNTVFLSLGGTYLKGAPGKNIIEVDSDNSTVTVYYGVFGIDSSGAVGGATNGIYVGSTSTGQISTVNNYYSTFAHLTNGVFVDGGTATVYLTDAVSIANAAVLCRSDSPPHNASTLANLYGTVTSANYGLFAGQGCAVASLSGAFGPNPYGGQICPSPKPLQYGVWMEGNAQASIGGLTTSCVNVDGVSLRANPNLSSNYPQAQISGALFRHSGCAGLYVEAGRANVQGSVVRNNHFGVWLNSSGSGTDPTQAPLSLDSGQPVASGYANHFYCNNSTEPGRCTSSGAFTTKGFSIFNESGWTVDANNNYFALAPPSSCTCDYQLQSCACKGAAFGETTPRDGLDVEKNPYSMGSPGIPVVTTLLNGIEANSSCTQ